MAKPKLLVILAAGSSVEQGMPRVSDLDVLMRTWSEEWVSELDHNIFRRENYFEKLRTAALARFYWRSHNDAESDCTERLRARNCDDGDRAGRPAGKPGGHGGLTWDFVDMTNAGGKIAIMWDKTMATVPFTIGM
jgi:hypothetical protein